MLISKVSIRFDKPIQRGAFVAVKKKFGDNVSKMVNTYVARGLKQDGFHIDPTDTEIKATETADNIIKVLGPEEALKKFRNIKSGYRHGGAK